MTFQKTDDRIKKINSVAILYGTSEFLRRPSGILSLFSASCAQMPIHRRANCRDLEKSAFFCSFTFEKGFFMEKNIKKKLSLIKEFLKGSKRFFLISMIFATVSALVDMLIPQIIRFTVDSVIGDSTADLPAFLGGFIENIGGIGYLKANLWIIALSVIAFAAVKVISQYTSCVCNAKGAETLSKTARDSLFEHISKLPCSWHAKNRTGDIIQRCTSDINTMNEFISEEMTDLFRVIVLLILSLVFMLNMHVPLTLIALGTFPVIIINSILFDRKIEKTFQKYDEGEGKLSAEVQENLTGVRVVRAFGQEAKELKKLRRQNSDITKTGIKIGNVFGSFFCISDILSGIQVMLVIISGAIFCIKGSMSPGEYIAFVSYNMLLSWPLNELGRMITGLGEANVSIERICYIMESQTEPESEKAEKPDLNRDIEFKNVSFSYNGKAQVLNGLNFKMKAGTTLGILGGTGSGKSTMMLLLDKIYVPDSGKITIGNVDINDIDTDYLRKNIGFVQQDPYLFSRTVAENISIACENASTETVKKAADAACLSQAVESFAKGYDTPVGERGVTLSGGQKQRVAIARILTRSTPIMIFDDSLSAVDTETDAKIRASLEKRFGTASIILISHRISTLSKADKILVLENGSIKEQGTHEELIARNGTYKAIYDIQSSASAKEEE